MPHFADALIANRAYSDHNRPPGEGGVVPGAGGLVAAVSEVIQPWDGDVGTLWIGAGRGKHDREFVDSEGTEVLDSGRGPLLHRRVFFDDETWTGHYEDISNSFLWPALHLVRQRLRERAAFFPQPQTPSPSSWEAYVRANRAFAAAGVASGRPSLWVHDYQLGLVPGELRAAGFAGAVGFFLHTPFPSLGPLLTQLDSTGADAFSAFVEGILGADLAGFQTPRDCSDFSRAAFELCGAEPFEGGVRHRGRDVYLRAFPVGVNARDVAGALGGALPAGAKTARASGLPLVVGLERADFTKGLPERMAAIERAYRSGARFAYYGSASPTRQGIALYDGFAGILGASVERAREAAAAANCPFAQAQESLSWSEVVALLEAADVVFTSSLADGMNLVPLQAVIAQRGRARRGVAIAGRDAGVSQVFAAFEGQGLTIIDPLDAEASARALAAALDGPGISDAFAAAVAANDAASWGSAFIEALEAANARP